MKLSKLLQQDKLSLSFEVFPPKTDTAFDSVKAATEEIAKLRPSFMSVTYGAGGGTSRYTLEIAKNIKDQYDVPTLAHLTCVSSTRETVAEKIKQMQEAITDDVEMMGYCPLSAIDLISTHEGMKKRYGFIYVDYDNYGKGTGKRSLKDSYDWYKKVIETNGEEL